MFSFRLDIFIFVEKVKIKIIVERPLPSEETSWMNRNESSRAEDITMLKIMIVGCVYYHRGVDVTRRRITVHTEKMIM